MTEGGHGDSCVNHIKTLGLSVRRGEKGRPYLSNDIILGESLSALFMEYALEAYLARIEPRAVRCDSPYQWAEYTDRSAIPPFIQYFTCDIETR